MLYPRRYVSIFPIKRSPRTGLSHDLFTTMSFWTDPRSQAKETTETGTWLMQRASLEFLKETTEQGIHMEGAKQKGMHICFLYNKSFPQNCLQLHCLYSTLGNSELLTWPSYVHDPMWHAGVKPHRHFVASEGRSNGTTMKLRDLYKVIKREIFLKEWWKNS